MTSPIDPVGPGEPVEPVEPEDTAASAPRPQLSANARDGLGVQATGRDCGD